MYFVPLEWLKLTREDTSFLAQVPAFTLVDWLVGWLIVLHVAGNEPSSLSPWSSVVLTEQTWANSLVYSPMLSSVDIKNVLPAFHVQVVKWTGDLGSNH
jgi:hypothetical protein